MRGDHDYSQEEDGMREEKKARVMGDVYERQKSRWYGKSFFKQKASYDIRISLVVSVMFIMYRQRWDFSSCPRGAIGVFG